MEIAVCNLCKGERTRVDLSACDWFHGSVDEFRLVRCLDCGLVFINPRPSPVEIGRYYNSEHYYTYQPESTQQKLILPQHAKLAARLTTLMGSNGKLLDVGCGSGSFLHAMVALGWQGTGTEIGVDLADRLRQQGLDVMAGEFTTLDLAQSNYNLVTLLEVLEHLHDPQAALRRVHDLLTPAGAVLVTVPNFESLECRLFGAEWVGLQPPLHLYQFSLSTLEAMLEKAGFRISHLASSDSVGGLTRSLWLLLRRRVRQNLDNADNLTGPYETWQQGVSWRQSMHHVLNLGLTPVGKVLAATGLGAGIEALAYRA